MKLTICTFLILFITRTAYAQPDKHTEVVLEIKNFSHQKHLQLINSTLKEAFGESHVASFCNANGWVVLYLDPHYYKSKEQLHQLLKPVGLEYFVKEGATAYEVETACKDVIKKY